MGVVDLSLKRSDFCEKELSFQVSCSYGPGRYDDHYEGGAKTTRMALCVGLSNAISQLRYGLPRPCPECEPTDYLKHEEHTAAGQRICFD